MFKLATKINEINPRVWQVLCLTASIALYIVILNNRTPNFMRGLSISLRTSFGIIILLTALVIYFLYRIAGRVGQLAGMTATLALFAMPLAGIWASGHTQSILISGLIPLTDAANYYADALRIIHGMEISRFSAMRPIFAGFLSFLLSLTNRNLMSALGILTALAALASYITAREIQQSHGAETAVFFLLAMFLYFRHHSGTTLSESLAVTISLLGMSLIWRGKILSNEWLTIFGVSITALALNIRPGAMFVLPALLIWGGWYFRRHNKASVKFLLIGTLSIGFIFYLNSTMIKLLAGPEGIAFENFSWAFYGLASGGNSWTYIFQAHPQVFLLPAQEQNLAIYKLAIDLIIQEPSLIIAGALKYWQSFFSNSWYNAFAFFAGGNYYVNEIARWGVYFLCGFGIIKWLGDHRDGTSSLVILGSLGILVSVPFVPPTDAYRVRLYAATIPFFGLLPALGIAYLRDKVNFRFFSKPEPDTPKTDLALPLSILMAAVLIIMPILIKSTGKSPAIHSASCAPDMDRIVIEFDEGTYVNVTRENIIFIDWMPNYHFSDFRLNIHSLADSYLIGFFESVRPPSTLFQTIDIQSGVNALVVIKTEELPTASQYLSLCGYWNTDSNLASYHIFHADYAIQN